MKQKINDFFYYFFGFPLWPVILLLVIALFVVILFPPNHKQYEANCMVGTYQVYYDGFNYYLQETDEEFFDYGNCVFVETKQ